MRVLVAISILAFAALLWASVAIFQHVRRARRRRRRALEASRNSLNPNPPAVIIAPPPPPPVVPEITFTDPEAPLPEITYTDPGPPPRELTSPSVQPYIRQAEVHATEPRTDTAAKLAPTTAAEEFLDTLPPPPIPSVPLDSSFSPLPAWPHFGFTPSRAAQPLRSTVTAPAEPELALAAEQAFEDQQASGRTPPPPAEPIPYAAPPLTESSAAVTAAARGPIQIQPPAPAVKPVYPSAHPTLAESTPQLPIPLLHRPGNQPVPRADWAYFNKDMGDLSDPAPAGSRSRIPAFVSQTPIKPKSD